jgi:hypothetical protein
LTFPPACNALEVGSSENRQLQVIEVPNASQRMHKLYIDWDKKLSQVAGICIIGDRDRLRDAALQAPADFLSILHKAGDARLHADNVKVVVKVCLSYV